MKLENFNELLEKYNFELEVDPTEETPICELGLDSFDMMMVLGDLENTAGKSLDLSLDSTVGEVLEKVSAAGC